MAISTDYKCYLDYLERHKQEYGEQPYYIEANFLDWQGQEIKRTKKTKIFGNIKAFAIHTPTEIYEVDPGIWGEKVIKVVDIEQYRRWNPPMPYNAYIDIL